MGQRFCCTSYGVYAKEGGRRMAQRKTTTIRQRLTTLIQRKRVEEYARDTGAVKRERKVKIFDFVWALILGFAENSERSIAGLRRAYKKATGVEIVPSAFYDRFTPQLVELLKLIVSDVIASVMPGVDDPDGVFAAFKEVLAVDATVIRLNDLLEKTYAACRTNHTKAAAKLHAIINVQGRQFEWIKLTGERVNDASVLKIGDWIAGKLLIFDLGYYKFWLFDRIAKHKGFFLSRLKENGNPLITGVYVGSGASLIGHKLQDVLGHLRRPVIDFEVQVRFRHRKYKGKRKGDKARFRLVGIRNPLTKEYHLYMTNIPVETVRAKQIAALYSARWMVELLFRELRSSYRIDDLPSSKKHVVEALIYASILTLVVSRDIQNLVAEKMPHVAHRIPEERWGIVFSCVAFEILMIAVGPAVIARVTEWRTLRFLRHEAIDPNAGRKRLPARVLSAGEQDEGS
jgi:IS4 transposase